MLHDQGAPTSAAGARPPRLRWTRLARSPAAASMSCGGCKPGSAAEAPWQRWSTRSTRHRLQRARMPETAPTIRLSEVFGANAGPSAGQGAVRHCSVTPRHRLQVRASPGPEGLLAQGASAGSTSNDRHSAGGTAFNHSSDTLGQDTATHRKAQLLGMLSLLCSQPALGILHRRDMQRTPSCHKPLRYVVESKSVHI